MKSLLRSIGVGLMPTVANKYRAASLLLDSSDSYLQKSGWMRSFLDGSPCKADGSPVPWMNYSFVAFLEQHLLGHHKLFEYGSGFSTSFYANRVKQVVSVEHDGVWFEKIRKDLPKNAILIYRNLERGSEYVDSVLPYIKEIDIVVVDGRRRVECSELALRNMNETAVLILDDSDRAKYKRVFDISRDLGFKSLRIQGLKPTGHWVEETTLFYRSGNCFGL